MWNYDDDEKLTNLVRQLVCCSVSQKHVGFMCGGNCETDSPTDRLFCVKHDILF